jgi:DNA ligase-1
VALSEIIAPLRRPGSQSSGSVTLSPVSVAALGTVSDTRGLSLRFPRFIKVRGDKTVETASSPDFLAAMYRGQQGKGKKKTCADDGELLDIEVEDESEIEEAESDSERRAK